MLKTSKLIIVKNQYYKQAISDCSEQNNQSFLNTASLLKRSKLMIGKKKHQY